MLVVIQNEQENEFIRRLSRDISGISLTYLYGSNISLSLSLFLSLSLSLYIYIYISIHPSFHPLINLLIPAVETVWIGGTDSTEEGSWTWKESTDAMSFTAWGMSQPNNYHDQDCLSLYKEFDFMWADEECLTTYKYICEKKSTVKWSV